jgi:ribonuclease E
MLIDGNHPEEIRVVILNGNRLEDYDIETSTKTQLKGNIYLAKVTRVEPSLQAAFVDYGGNRHGFLAFSEIHPDYYQIPIEDREALKRDLSQLADNAQAAQAHVDEMDEDDGARPMPRPSESAVREDAVAAAVRIDRVTDDQPAATDRPGESPDGEDGAAQGDQRQADSAADAEPSDPEMRSASESAADDSAAHETIEDEHAGGTPAASPSQGAAENGGRRRRPPRRYRIQEVIKRRQILLVQVVKEERGNKGAALTTYLSLAGRYCVLMPNAARVGGVSRKITSTADRRRLRDLLNSLEVPDGMGVIMRTAGMERTKAEIKRDLDYLLRLWEDVRELTLTSTAPTLVYEEGNLIKRAIRDLYARDIEEVLVEGNDAYQTAKKFMRLMMPSHAKRVKQYRDPMIPLFHRYQVESQLEAMHSPVVHLKSGGYIVINPTEALVAIDVNSGRATRERNIEETAVKTNLEAASEIARQLRLRDLAGLIVIDFIDMEEGRNQRAVEKRIKESVKTDRARIQLGRISTFGLFELSRQRLRPSLIETSSQACPHCNGTGHVRSTESTAIRILRALEDEGIRRRTAEVTIAVATPVALYILNQKRHWLADIERRYSFAVKITGDDTLVPPEMRLERTRARTEAEVAELPPIPAEAASIVEDEAEPEAEALDETETEAGAAGEAAETGAPPGHEGGQRERGRRRRRRRRRRDDGEGHESYATRPPADSDHEPAELEDADHERHEGGDLAAAGTDGEADHEGRDERHGRRRRRGRRGGRRRRGREEASADMHDAQPEHGGGAEEIKATFVPAGIPEAEAVPEPAAPPPEHSESGSLSLDIPMEAADRPIEEPAPQPSSHAPRPAAAESASGNGSGHSVPEPGADDESTRPAEQAAEPPSEEPKAPPRRGWWQRITESH